MTPLKKRMSEKSTGLTNRVSLVRIQYRPPEILGGKEAFPVSFPFNPNTIISA